MIARTGREVIDYGPSPAGVDGLSAANAVAGTGITFGTEVIRRPATPEELERLSPPEPVAADPAPRRVRTVFVGPPTRHTDDEAWDAIRAAGGNLAAAARMLGQDRGTFRQRVDRRRAIGRVPLDVLTLMRDYRAAGLRHDEATRRRISEAVRRHLASKAIA